MTFKKFLENARALFVAFAILFLVCYGVSRLAAVPLSPADQEKELDNPIEEVHELEEDGVKYTIRYLYYELYKQVIIYYEIPEIMPYDPKKAEFAIFVAEQEFIKDKNHRWYHIYEIYRKLSFHSEGKTRLMIRCNLSK